MGLSSPLLPVNILVQHCHECLFSDSKRAKLETWVCPLLIGVTTAVIDLHPTVTLTHTVHTTHKMEQDEWSLFFNLHSTEFLRESLCELQRQSKWGAQVWIRRECVRELEQSLLAECVCVCVCVCVCEGERSISFIWQKDQIWRHVPEPERFSASRLPTCPAAHTGYSIRQQPQGSTRQKGKMVALTPK